MSFTNMENFKERTLHHPQVTKKIRNNNNKKTTTLND